MLFCSFINLTHLHAIIFFLKLSNFSTHFYLWLKVLLLFLLVFFEGFLMDVHKFAGFFPHLFEGLSFINSSSQIQWLIFLCKLFLELLLVSELFHFLWVIEQVLGKFADDLEPFFRSYIKFIKNLQNGQGFDYVNFVVGILHQEKITRQTGFSLKERSCRDFGSSLESTFSIWLVFKLRPASLPKLFKFSTFDIKLSFKAKYSRFLRHSRFSIRTILF